MLRRGELRRAGELRLLGAVTRIGMNGFGRTGRLALRAGWGGPDLIFAHVNEIAGDAATAAHLLMFDSIHGRFGHDATGAGETLTIGGTAIAYTAIADPGQVPWDEHGVDEVNGLLAEAALGSLAGILGYEERRLVSVDYKDDPRSGIVDALSTMVVDGTQVKILAWYDNEWGYANRLVELARIVAASLPAVDLAGR
jgi:glyceraldehyde-3-phosphate dehydrogenase/erythrose-4-phosphate dehydrogenase